VGIVVKRAAGQQPAAGADRFDPGFTSNRYDKKSLSAIYAGDRLLCHNSHLFHISELANRVPERSGASQVHAACNGAELKNLKGGRAQRLFGMTKTHRFFNKAERSFQCLAVSLALMTAALFWSAASAQAQSTIQPARSAFQRSLAAGGVPTSPFACVRDNSRKLGQRLHRGKHAGRRRPSRRARRDVINPTATRWRCSATAPPSAFPCSMSLPFDPVRISSRISSIGLLRLRRRHHVESFAQNAAGPHQVRARQSGKLNVGTIVVGSTRSLC